MRTKRYCPRDVYGLGNGRCPRVLVVKGGSKVPEGESAAARSDAIRLRRLMPIFCHLKAFPSGLPGVHAIADRWGRSGR